MEWAHFGRGEQFELHTCKGTRQLALSQVIGLAIQVGIPVSIIERAWAVERVVMPGVIRGSVKDGVTINLTTADWHHRREGKLAEGQSTQYLLAVRSHLLVASRLAAAEVQLVEHTGRNEAGNAGRETREMKGEIQDSDGVVPCQKCGSLIRTEIDENHHLRRQTKDQDEEDDIVFHTPGLCRMGRRLTRCAVTSGERLHERDLLVTQARILHRWGDHKLQQ